MDASGWHVENDHRVWMYSMSEIMASGWETASVATTNALFIRHAGNKNSHCQRS